VISLIFGVFIFPRNKDINMRKLFNLKLDKRTAWNIAKIPFIICIRTPVVLFFIGVAWVYGWSDTIYDKLPGWDR